MPHRKKNGSGERLAPLAALPKDTLHITGDECTRRTTGLVQRERAFPSFEALATKSWQVIASIEILQRSIDIVILARSENVAEHLVSDGRKGFAIMTNMPTHLTEGL
ncbi:hypothetical protein ACVWVY_007688 [Bradyrhizobium sp. URHC0002]